MSPNPPSNNHTCPPTPPPPHSNRPGSIPSISAKSIRRGLYLHLTPRVPYGTSTSIFFTDFFKTRVTDLAKKGGTATSNTTSQNIMTNTWFLDWKQPPVWSCLSYKTNTIKKKIIRQCQKHLASSACDASGGWVLQHAILLAENNWDAFFFSILWP